MKSIFTILSIIAVVIAVVLIGPILTIWSANTLFPALAIPYTLETWVAALILAGIFSQSTKGGK